MVLDRGTLEAAVARRANSPAALLIQGDSRWIDGTNIIPVDKMGDLRPAVSNAKGWIIAGSNSSKQCWIGVERCIGKVSIPYNLCVNESIASHTYTSMKITNTSITLTGPEARHKIPLPGYVTLRAVANPAMILDAFNSINEERPKTISFKEYPVLRSLRLNNVVANLRAIYGSCRAIDYNGDKGYTIRHL